MKNIEIHYTSGIKDHLYDLEDVIVKDDGLILFHNTDNEIYEERIHFDDITRYAIAEFVDIAKERYTATCECYHLLPSGLEGIYSRNLIDSMTIHTNFRDTIEQTVRDTIHDSNLLSSIDEIKVEIEVCHNRTKEIEHLSLTVENFPCQ